MICAFDFRYRSQHRSFRHERLVEPHGADNPESNPATPRQEETSMRHYVSSSMMSVTIAVSAVSAVAVVSISRPWAQAPTPKPSASQTFALQTPWGEPDLQGIWTDESDTPMQRSPRYANQEFFTDAQRADLHRQRSALIGR